MNAFGEALNLVFMRGSGCFSSGSYSLPMNLRLHSHESLFPANESQKAFHEFKFLFPANESQTAFHEFKFLFPANESQTAIFSSYLPATESLDAFP